MKRPLFLFTLAAALGFVLTGLLLVVGAPWWVALGACLVLGIVWPLPKSEPAAVCSMCVDGRHIHDVNDGTCIRQGCECEGAR